ncbi:Rne/Rng family ribonuclease [Zavarzinia sp. CC-PAN008]|uniref:Rne/Rng family ribonuclease n=1 Tax=Zavarzinia sp. CC-PAN008 TaxID=3243332 RepID=UPI003F744485
MTTRMLIDATHPEETRVVVVRGNRIEDFDFESATKKQLKGNIYLAKVTRVEPSLQAAFVEYGGNRHGFLAFSEIHPDYYQIPIADRQALLAQQAEDAARAEAEADRAEQARARRRSEQEAAGQTASADDDEFDSHIETVEGEDETETIDGGSDNLADEGDSAATGESSTAAAATGGEDDEPADAPRRPSLALNVDHAPEPVLEGPVAEAVPESGPDAEPEAVPEATATAAAEPVAQAEVPAADDTTAEGPTAESAPAEPDAGTDTSVDAAPEAEATGEDGAAGDEGDVADVQARNAEVTDEQDDDDQDDGDSGSSEARPARRPRFRSVRSYKIQEVIKRRQILLVQVVKEERGNKGAALTTYISLAGRYCVLMPNTSRGGGISRKIVNPADRKRLKEITADLDIQDGMGVIVRTAGLNRTKPEIKRDFEYLLRLWDSVRQLTLQSTAPALVYEEGDLIKRVIRDMYSKDIEEILVEGEEAYRQAKDFMRMLIPSHARNVQPYRERVPLFHRFQVEQQLDLMFNPVVQLKSGGYIVINQTEALVAIDVNSGRSTREHNIEETATKTNLEASEEIARQLRLRDLAGLIVIDFIDMEDARNNRSVEKRLKESLKADRARIQIGRISPFGLLELSRQRLHPGLMEASTDVCPHCAGVGRVRSIESSALHVLRAVEDEGVRERSAAITVRCATPIALYILNQKRSALRAIEERYGLEVMVDADPALIPPAFRLERLRPRTDAPPPVAIRHGAVPMIDYDDEDEPVDDAVALDADDAAEDAAESRGAGERAEGRSGEGRSGEGRSGESRSGDAQSEDRQRRRRRRRRGGRADAGSESETTARGAEDEDEDASTERPSRETTGDATAQDEDGATETAAEGDGAAAGEPERRRRRRSRRGGRRNGTGEGEANGTTNGRQPRAWPDESVVAVVPHDESWPDLGEAPTAASPADESDLPTIEVSEAVAVLIEDAPDGAGLAAPTAAPAVEAPALEAPEVEAPAVEAAVADTPVAEPASDAAGNDSAVPEAVAAEPTATDAAAPEVVEADSTPADAPAPAEAAAVEVQPVPEPAEAVAPAPVEPPQPEAPKAPPRRGWWQRSFGG